MWGIWHSKSGSCRLKAVGNIGSRCLWKTCCGFHLCYFRKLMGFLSSTFPGKNEVLNTTILIRSCVQSAVGMLRDQNESTSRSTKRIEILLSLLCEEDDMKGMNNYSSVKWKIFEYKPRMCPCSHTLPHRSWTPHCKSYQVHFYCNWLCFFKRSIEINKSCIFKHTEKRSEIDIFCGVPIYPYPYYV